MRQEDARLLNRKFIVMDGITDSELIERMAMIHLEIKTICDNLGIGDCEK